jgi:hypothetical protein
MKSLEKLFILASALLVAEMSRAGTEVKAVQSAAKSSKVAAGSHLDPKYTKLQELLSKARKDQKAAIELDRAFGADEFSFSDPNVLNIVFNEFNCKDSSDLVYRLLAPELSQDLSKDPKGVMQAVFLVQTSRLNERVPIFKKFLRCLGGDKPDAYHQLDSLLSDEWGEYPPPMDIGEVAEERSRLLRRMAQTTQSQIKNLERVEFMNPQTKEVFRLTEEQQARMKKILSDFEAGLNKFVPVGPRGAGKGSSSTKVHGS